MTLHSGTGTGSHYAGSLAESIEAAFAGELFALRGDKLPETAIEDRRMLFAAIARGVLQHLAQNPAELDVLLPPYLAPPVGVGPPVPKKDKIVNVLVRAPVLWVTGGDIHGSGWTTGDATLRLVTKGDQPPEDKYTVTPDADGGLQYGGFSGSMQSGDIVDGRDTTGRAAQAVVP